MKIYLMVAAVALLVIVPGVASACSCGGYPSVCQSYLGAEAVFVGSVRQVEQKIMKDDEGREHISSQVAHVQVETVFKGMKETEVIFRSYGSSCDAEYKEGQRWLFYAYYNKKDKAWGIQACDRSTLIEGAAGDLLYLQGLPASAQKTRISGELSHYEDDPVNDFSRVKNLIGVRVKIIGAQKTYETFTDKNGIYEINGLPPGKYTIEPETAPGLKLYLPIGFGEMEYSDKGTAKVVLREKGCAGMDFIYSADTSVSGTVYGADGRPLPHVCLSLMPKDKTVAGNWKFDCTEEGRYKINRIPPGEYIVVVNDEGKISSNAPFPTTYYPGVFEKEKATVLTITDGSNLENLDIHIPSQEATRVIEGVLLYADGRPVVDEFVWFKPEALKEGYDADSNAKTDAQGRFTITVLQGLKGRVYGETMLYESKYTNCPQVQKIIKAKGERFFTFATKPVSVETNRDIQDVKLYFSFPYCDKSK